MSGVFEGMSVNVKVVDNSQIFINAKNEAVAAALEAIGLTAERHAKEKCPVDTGRLRNSISHAVSESEQAVYIGTNVEYAAYVEMGTHRTKAQPYLKPAAANHGSEYRRIAEAQLKKA